MRKSITFYSVTK